MKKIGFVILVFVSLFLITNAQTINKEYAGKWILNQDKSETSGGMGGRMGGPSSKLNVDLQDNVLIVETFRVNRNGEETSNKLFYQLNGKESHNSSNFGEIVSNVKIGEDGSLIIKSTMTISRNGNDMTVDSEETWNLTEGALIIKSTRSTPMGSMESKGFYDKTK